MIRSSYTPKRSLSAETETHCHRRHRLGSCRKGISPEKTVNIGRSFLDCA